MFNYKALRLNETETIKTLMADIVSLKDDIRGLKNQITQLHNKHLCRGVVLSEEGFKVRDYNEWAPSDAFFPTEKVVVDLLNAFEFTYSKAKGPELIVKEEE